MNAEVVQINTPRPTRLARLRARRDLIGQLLEQARLDLYRAASFAGRRDASKDVRALSAELRAIEREIAGLAVRS